MKVEIECMELYPFYDFEKINSHTWTRDVIEIPDEKIQWFMKLAKDIKEAQNYLKNLHDKKLDDPTYLENVGRYKGEV